MTTNGAWFTVRPQQLKTCKRCGEGSLAWAQSAKTGRFYLARTRAYISDERFVDSRWVMPNLPHRCEERTAITPTA